MANIALHLNRDWFEKNKDKFLKAYQTWNAEFSGEEPLKPEEEEYRLEFEFNLDDTPEFSDQHLNFSGASSGDVGVWMGVDNLPLGERTVFSILEWSARMLNKVKTLFEIKE